MFRAFFDLVAEVCATLDIDLPYVIGCAYMDAEDSVLLFNDRHSHRLAPIYPRDEIRWPTHVRTVGEDWTNVASQLCLEMFNAFGLSSAEEEHVFAPGA